MATRAARMGFWDLDLVTGDMHLSSHTTELVGMPARWPRLTGRIHGAGGVADQEKMLDAIRRVLNRRSAAQVNVEYRIRRPMARLRWFHTMGRTVELTTAPPQPRHGRDHRHHRAQTAAGPAGTAVAHAGRSPVVAMIWIPTGPGLWVRQPQRAPVGL